jgi:hypothetical protein
MQNPLSNTGNYFQARYKKADGSEFFGQMLDIPDTSRVSNFLSPRRYLRTKVTSPIKPTDVVIIDGVTFIVAEHGTGFYKTPIYKHFKLFEVDNLAVWQKNELEEDAITGIQKIIRVTQPGAVYLSVQPKSIQEDTLKIPLGTYLAVCNQLVSRDDILDNKAVIKVDKVLGVYIVELKEL